jgi:hypothetical protein
MRPHLVLHVSGDTAQVLLLSMSCFNFSPYRAPSQQTASDAEKGSNRDLGMPSYGLVSRNLTHVSRGWP